MELGDKPRRGLKMDFDSLVERIDFRWRNFKGVTGGSTYISGLIWVKFDTEC